MSEDDTAGEAETCGDRLDPLVGGRGVFGSGDRAGADIDEELYGDSPL